MKIRPGIILLLFTLIVLAHNLRVPVTYLYYVAATEDFIERLCENKDRPELNCDGKCYLAKMLQESGNEENPLPKEQFSWPDKLVFIPETGAHQQYIADEPREPFSIYTNFYHLILPESVFHPPNIIV